MLQNMLTNISQHANGSPLELCAARVCWVVVKLLLACSVLLNGC